MAAVEREEVAVVVIERAEIDTRPPFRSVKEAVMLFGEKVLVGEIYGNKLREMQTKTREHVSKANQQPQVGVVSAELEETKQSLEKAKEESHLVAHYLQSLKQDLEETKRELRQLKRRDSRETIEEQPRDVEELKFIEKEEENGKFAGCFEKKRSVKFASPPSTLARVITANMEDHVETSPNSKRKMKRKPLFHLFRTLFSKKKGSEEGVSQNLT